MVVLYFNRNNFCKTKIQFCNTGISWEIPVIAELHCVQDGEFQNDSLKRQFIRVSKDCLARNYLARNVSTEVQPLGGHLVISLEQNYLTLTLFPFGLCSFPRGDIF